VRPARKIAGNAPNDASPNFVLASRIVLLLIAQLLIASPWTEGYRLLDNFPREQDSELNLIALLAFLGLILLLVRASRRSLRAMFALRNWLWFVLRPMWLTGSRALHRPAVDAPVIPPLLVWSLGAFSLPLQI